MTWIHRRAPFIVPILPTPDSGVAAIGANPVTRGALPFGPPRGGDAFTGHFVFLDMDELTVAGDTLRVTGLDGERDGNYFVQYWLVGSDAGTQQRKILLNGTTGNNGQAPMSYVAGDSEEQVADNDKLSLYMFPTRDRHYGQVWITGQFMQTTEQAFLNVGRPGFGHAVQWLDSTPLETTHAGGAVLDGRSGFNGDSGVDGRRHVSYIEIVNESQNFDAGSMMAVYRWRAL